MLSKRGIQLPEYKPPLVDPIILPKEHVEEPGLNIKLKKKQKYVQGETKPDIIDNIIEYKPPLASVRKAMQEYVRMTERERDP
jgi:hypothetical protein